MVCQTVNEVMRRIDEKYSDMYPPAVLAGRCDFDGGGEGGREGGCLPKTVVVASETF